MNVAGPDKYVGPKAQMWCHPTATYRGPNNICGILYLNDSATFSGAQVENGSVTTIGVNSTINYGSIFYGQVTIGKNTVVFSAYFYNSKVGDNVQIGNRSSIWGTVEDNAVIEEYAVLGDGATLAAGKKIGTRSCVEYKGVVQDDLPPYVTMREDGKIIRNKPNRIFQYMNGGCVVTNTNYYFNFN